MENFSESYSADVRRVVPVSEFTRHASAYLGELSGTRTPLVLTVNGKAAAVLQDADTYQEMVELIQLLAQGKRQGVFNSEENPAFSDRLQTFLEAANKRNLNINFK